ncbi:MAG: crossover junction endodeoxyribonuclease RuvC [Christensenellales bacterium]|jgi:crossover junction endodeoxyribonuclease RuvC
MIILGIDPGLATIGYGVINAHKGAFSVVDYGVICTPVNESAPVRLKMIGEGISALIERFKPDEIAVEQLFFAKNVKTALSVAEARGVILYSVVTKCGKLYEYTPNQIKVAITGYGSADKYQIQNMVKILLKLPAIPKPDDAADALAVALCHGHTDKFRNLHIL